MVNVNKQGFTLIELMISLAIFGLLLSLAAPSYSLWIASLRVNNISQNINMAIAQARSEAMRTNSLVEISLNKNTSWQIKVLETNSIINKKIKEESGATTEISFSPLNTTKITFNGLGVVTNNIDSSSTVKEIIIYSTLQNEALKSKKIIIHKGSSFICDPSQESSTNNLYCKEGV